MAAHNELGARAERLAAELLERNGWTILHRNWRSGPREIDLIARRGATIAFVEVKARSRATHGHPLESIGWRKRRDLACAARDWIHRYGRPEWEYRFDAVDVLPAATGAAATSAPLRVRHTANAWSM